MRITKKQVITTIKLGIGLLAVSFMIVKGKTYFFPANTTVTIDFSRPLLHKNPYTGFLLSLDGSEPNDSLIMPLKPSFWRVIHLDRSQKIRDNKSNVHFIIGDVWRLEYAIKGKSPLQDIERWDNYVKKTIANIPKEYASSYFIELWNEPDQYLFWEYTKEELFELYLHTSRIIKSYSSLINIGGPSVSECNKKFILDFLKFAEQKNAPVDFFTWHELSVKELNKISTNIAFVKREAAKLYTRNKNLKNNVYISEYGGQSQQYDLNYNFTYLHYLLKADVAGASKSCWDDGVNNNCWNSSIDGLLDEKKKPRAIWYMYRLFAEGIDKYYKVEDSGSNALVLVSKVGETYRILISRNQTKSFTDIKQSRLTLNLNKFKIANKEVRLYTLTDSNGDYSYTANKDYHINEAQSKIIINDFLLANKNSILVLEIR